MQSVARPEDGKEALMYPCIGVRSCKEKAHDVQVSHPKILLSTLLLCSRAASCTVVEILPQRRTATYGRGLSRPKCL